MTGVATGEEALAAAEDDPPDLVALDLMLPGMDGLTVCRRLKRDFKTAALPIVMLRFLGIISRQVDRLDAIIDDLLTLSRLEKGSEDRASRLEPGALSGVLQAVGEMCERG